MDACHALWAAPTALRDLEVTDGRRWGSIGEAAAPWCLTQADCINAMRAMPEASVDAVVTDPPYFIGFMGKEFDSQHLTFVERKSASVVGSFESVVGNHNPVDSQDQQRTRLAEGRRAQGWHEAWAREALRVLKPGGHLLAFGGTRTSHRLVCGIENVGFEIRDCLLWLYGSGFPKSLDVARSIDKAAKGHPQGTADPDSPNAGRFKTSATEGKRSETDRGQHFGAGLGSFMREPGERYERVRVPEAEPWRGWGTALKPGYEPIAVARKPLVATVAENVLTHGVGALNIDACRVPFVSYGDEAESKGKNRHEDFGSGPRRNEVYGSDQRDRGANGNYDPPGRWPANVILSHAPSCRPLGRRTVATNGHAPAETRASTIFGAANGGGLNGVKRDAVSLSSEIVELWECVAGCPVAELDRQSGASCSAGGRLANISTTSQIYGGGNGLGQSLDPQSVRGDPGYGDVGGASRFFYVAKASRWERETGCGTLPLRNFGQSGGAQQAINEGKTEYIQTGNFGLNRVKQVANDHPTVKPVALMRHLVRLITPKGGLVLDPFAGSGTTGIAAMLEGMRFIGIEKDDHYCEIARARIQWATEHPEDFDPEQPQIVRGQAKLGEF